LWQRTTTSDGQFLLQCLDISERKEAEQQLELAARADALTGIPNRTRFLELLREAIAIWTPSDRQVAVIFLDVDDFKIINDSLGHGFRAGLLAGGDDLLRDQIALRRRRRSDMHRFDGHFDMHGIAIGIRIDRDGGNPHLARRLDDATGDLATVGDQDFREHAEVIPLRSVVPFMTCACGVKPTMQITAFQSICDSNSSLWPSLGTSF
jgi:hypothetical protein